MGPLLEPEKLHQQIIRLDHLPTLPAVAVQLISRWNDPKLSVGSVAELLKQDPSLSSRVLKVANSSRYGLRQEITSISHAAALLGLNTLRCVTLAVSVFETFADYKADWTRTFDLDEFRRHCLAVGIAAEMLSARFGNAASEEAFLVGLLHDIGKLGLLATIPDSYTEVIEKAKPGYQSLLEHEKQMLAVTHAEVGKWICERWGLPETFRRGVWLHHQSPVGTPKEADSPSPLEKIVHLADLLDRRSRIGDSGNHYQQSDDLWLNRHFGFEAEDLKEFAADLLPRVQKAGETFELETPTVQVYLKSLQDANRLLASHSADSETELVDAKERNEFLQRLSEIGHLPTHDMLEVDVLGQAADIILQYLELPWLLILVHDTSYQSIQGVLYGEGLSKPETFYRVLSVVEEEKAKERDARSSISLLGETVLSSGKRVNLRDSVTKILQTGSLLAFPILIDESTQGECFLDATGSRVQQSRYRGYLESLLEATAKLFERAKLYRKLRRESEAATEALRRESEAHRQLFHFERLASVGRLAAGAAHEINNPLAVISGKAQLLLMGEKDEETREALGAIIEQTMRISKIISDLMGYARPAEPEVAPNPLRPLVENALYMAGHRLPEHTVEVLVEIPEDLPDLRVDGRQIEQVLVNLFVNAIQAMEGIGLLTVRAEHEKKTGAATIQISDSGPGIPADDLHRIFDPFFTTKKEGEGTGLGLAVSHRIIENHGGRMTASSRSGQGTTFTIQLPCDGEGEQTGSPKTPAKKQTRRTSGKKRLLLVDDEQQLSDLIRDFLQDAGYVVDQAADGVEAIERLGSQIYDALILDIRMPRKDGIEVLEDLKASTTGMPILVVTGLASNDEIDLATASGADKILKKPFQLDELLHAVEGLTRRRRGSSKS